MGLPVQYEDRFAVVTDSRRLNTTGCDPIHRYLGVNLIYNGTYFRVDMPETGFAESLKDSCVRFVHRVHTFGGRFQRFRSISQESPNYLGTDHVITISPTQTEGATHNLIL